MGRKHSNKDTRALLPQKTINRCKICGRNKVYTIRNKYKCTKCKNYREKVILYFEKEKKFHNITKIKKNGKIINYERKIIK